MGKTDTSFQHNMHISGGVTVSTHIHSEVRVQKLLRMLVSCIFFSYPLNCRLRCFLTLGRR